MTPERGVQDPTLERLERVFERALAMVRSLKEGRRGVEEGMS